MLRTIGIITLIILVLLSAGGITGTIVYYRRYTSAQASLSDYITECGKLRTGFEEARQLILGLAERNRTIAEAARKGLSIIEGKLDP